MARYYRSTTPSSTPSSLPSGIASPRPQTPDATVRKRTPSRAQKLLGDLYLLSARYNDAMRAYVLAIEGTRANADYIWQASALEGLCCCISILAQSNASDFGPLPALNGFLGTAAGSTSSLGSSDTLAQTTTATQIRTHAKEMIATYKEIVALYEKGRAWGVVHAEACIKAAHWLVAPETSHLAATNNTKSIGKMEQVSQWLTRGWAYAGLSMTDMEKIHIASAAARVCAASSNGRRKRAFWLRQVTAIVFPIVRREIEQGLQSGLSHVSGVFEEDSIVDEALQKRVLYCLQNICPAYGLEFFIHGQPELMRPTGVLAAMFDDWEAESDLFGWPELQVVILKECIGVSDILGGMFSLLFSVLFYMTC